MNYLPARVTGKILFPTIEEEAAARGGRVLILRPRFTQTSQVIKKTSLSKKPKQVGLQLKCIQCQFDNREGVKFCKECGTNLEEACLKCGTVHKLDSKFCDECGYSLAQESQIDKTEPTGKGERKHVTVLFSDLSGYTAMSDRLEPEEVKEITGLIFGEIAKIVNKYNGFIEKYAGDAVMALFGANRSHEDDPVRAIKAAKEIHDLVQTLSPEYELTLSI